jgi:hypothetical protein
VAGLLGVGRLLVVEGHAQLEDPSAVPTGAA